MKKQDEDWKGGGETESFSFPLPTKVPSDGQYQLLQAVILGAERVHAALSRIGEGEKLAISCREKRVQPSESSRGYREQAASTHTRGKM